VHEILITHIAETEAVMKELTHLITPAEVVSWLCSSVKVCCHLSNPADGNIFYTTALKLWPNGVASCRKLKTCANLRLRLAMTCVYLR